MIQVGLPVLKARSWLQRPRHKWKRPHNHCSGQRKRRHCYAVSVRVNKRLYYLPQARQYSDCLPLPFRLRIAKMNKEMREMDGAFGQSGPISEEQECRGVAGGARGGRAHTKRRIQAKMNQISDWALGGVERLTELKSDLKTWSITPQIIKYFNIGCKEHNRKR